MATDHPGCTAVVTESVPGAEAASRRRRGGVEAETFAINTTDGDAPLIPGDAHPSATPEARPVRDRQLSTLGWHDDCDHAGARKGSLSGRL
jgi:hypothetical protein